MIGKNLFFGPYKQNAAKSKKKIFLINEKYLTCFTKTNNIPALTGKTRCKRYYLTYQVNISSWIEIWKEMF